MLVTCDLSLACKLWLWLVSGFIPLSAGAHCVTISGSARRKDTPFTFHPTSQGCAEDAQKQKKNFPVCFKTMACDDKSHRLSVLVTAPQVPGLSQRNEPWVNLLPLRLPRRKEDKNDALFSGQALWYVMLDRILTTVNRNLSACKKFSPRSWFFSTLFYFLFTACGRERKKIFFWFYFSCMARGGV